MTIKDNADDEAKHIVETVAKIIKNKLKEFLQSNTTGYPSHIIYQLMS